MLLGRRGEVSLSYTARALAHAEHASSHTSACDCSPPISHGSKYITYFYACLVEKKWGRRKP